MATVTEACVLDNRKKRKIGQQIKGGYWYIQKKLQQVMQSSKIAKERLMNWAFHFCTLFYKLNVF